MRFTLIAPTVTRRLADEVATRRLGVQLAARLQSGICLYLSGPLGAGKTTLVRALLRALGEHGRIRSPTFTLMEPYRAGGFDIVHLDLYRFETPQELLESGFDECFGGDTIALVEWPERAGTLLPAPDLAIALRIDAEGSDGDGPEGRWVTLTAHTARGEALLAGLDGPVPGSGGPR